MKVLAFILAGGKGTRLEPLVKTRCKPGVPFGGKFRIIDFTLSNCINSGIRQVNVMVQYHSESLQKHIRDGWSFLSAYLGEYIDVYPPQQRVGDHMYTGTADAVFQNLYTMEVENPDYVLILGGDHIYKMDYRTMINAHRENEAALTIGALPVPKEDAHHFGIIVCDNKYKITQFQEKPEIGFPMPGNPDFCLGSMGIYVFDIKKLKQYLLKDSTLDTEHDFGKNIIPEMLMKKEPIYVYPFQDEDGTPRYWRDVGTIKAYYETNMDLLKENSELDLDDPDWLIRSYDPYENPAKIIKKGSVRNALLSGGVTILGEVSHSIISGNVFIGEDALVKDSILFDSVKVGKAAVIENAILDKDVIVNSGVKVNKDLFSGQPDWKVTSEGVLVIPKGAIIK